MGTTMNINSLTLKSLVATAALIASTAPMLAQHQPHAASPHYTINAVIDDDSITLSYGSPFTKNPRTGEPRKIWGKVVPFGKVWRTGADEATTLTTKSDLKIGDTEVPAGTYTLYTLPESDGSAKLIINKQTGQWGTEYDEKQDLARVDMKKETASCPADHFVMRIEHGSSGGVLRMKWEDVEYSLPFTVKK
jgi:Protein of unknown function (DUF2911)